LFCETATTGKAKENAPVLVFCFVEAVDVGAQPAVDIDFDGHCLNEAKAATRSYMGRFAIRAPKIFLAKSVVQTKAVKKSEGRGNLYPSKV